MNGGPEHQAMVDSCKWWIQIHEAHYIAHRVCISTFAESKHQKSSVFPKGLIDRRAIHKKRFIEQTCREIVIFRQHFPPIVPHHGIEPKPVTQIITRSCFTFQQGLPKPGIIPKSKAGTKFRSAWKPVNDLCPGSVFISYQIAIRKGRGEKETRVTDCRHSPVLFGMVGDSGAVNEKRFVDIVRIIPQRKALRNLGSSSLSWTS